MCEMAFAQKRSFPHFQAYGLYNGTVQTPLRTNEDGNLYVATEVISQVPNFREFLRKVLLSNQTIYSTYSIVEDTAIKEIHLGGRVSCEAVLGKFDSSYVNLFGTFNSSIE